MTAGAAALDAHVARRAAEAGMDLTFLRTIPGAIGGAARMNAGCYGRYIADVFVSAEAVFRDGSRATLEGRRPGLRLSPQRSAAGLRADRGDAGGAGGRSGGARRADGGADRQA